MSNFKGTRGEVFEQQQMIQTKDEFICDIICLDEKFQANANLIVDAFNVRQQINYELSELLEQNKEMLAMLELLIQEFDRENATEYEFQVCYKAKQLIKKVKDNE